MNNEEDQVDDNNVSMMPCKWMNTITGDDGDDTVWLV